MKSCKLSDITRVFQFTPLREGRRGNGCQHGADRRISIHAPPRGATRAARTEQPHPLYFNSRPSARGDIPSMNATRRGFLFQFTPLREGRRAKPRRSIGIYFYFNSRPSARGDGMKVFMKESLRISIHAPPRGATTWTAAGTLRRSFQFTPLREGRRRNSSAATRPPSFQFTPLREGRLC